MPKNLRSYSTTISVFALMLVIGAYALLHSPFFLVQNIHASGSSYTTTQLAKIAGIEIGTSLLKLNVELAESYLEEEPIIYRAIVRRHLPGTVVIEVEERTPIAAVPNGLEFWGVAADGTVLGPLNMAGISLPIITGADPKELVIGRKNLSELVMGASILQGLAQGMRDQISEVNVEIRDGLRLICRNLVQFYLGGPGQMQEKLQIVAAFLPKLGQAAPQSGAFVDVSNPNRPVVRK